MISIKIFSNYATCSSNDLAKIKVATKVSNGVEWKVKMTHETEFMKANILIINVVKKMKNNGSFWKKRNFRHGNILPTQTNNSAICLGELQRLVYSSFIKYFDKINFAYVLSSSLSFCPPSIRIVKINSSGSRDIAFPEFNWLHSSFGKGLENDFESVVSRKNVGFLWIWTQKTIFNISFKKLNYRGVSDIFRILSNIYDENI